MYPTEIKILMEGNRVPGMSGDEPCDVDEEPLEQIEGSTAIHYDVLRHVPLSRLGKLPLAWSTVTGHGSNDETQERLVPQELLGRHVDRQHNEREERGKVDNEGVEIVSKLDVAQGPSILALPSCC